MAIRVGTSGFIYEHWRHRFYPPSARGSELEHYARTFDTVELNVTFYRMPPRSTFRSWAARVPDDFVFAVKASRYLTHVRRLKDPRPSVELLVDRASELGSHLGPILIQLPPDLELDLPATRGRPRRVPGEHPAGGRAAPRLVVRRGRPARPRGAQRRPLPRRPARPADAAVANGRLVLCALPRRPGDAEILLQRPRARAVGRSPRGTLGRRRHRLRVLQQRRQRLRAPRCGRLRPGPRGPRRSGRQRAGRSR